MMNDSNKDDIIKERIRIALESQEEVYLAGAWENFNHYRNRKRKIVFLKLTSGIAACLIALWLVFSIAHPESEPSENFTRITLQPNYSETTSPNDSEPQIPPSFSDLYDENLITGVKDLPATNITNNENDMVSHTRKAEENKEINTYISEITNENVHTPPTQEKQDRPESHEQIQFLSRQPEYGAINYEIQQEGSKDLLRWGLYFSPGFNSTSFNTNFAFAGGMSIDFKLSQELYFNTGIQIEHQYVNSQKPNNDYMGISRETNSDLVILDVPLNITWKFLTNPSRAWYITGGISSLAFLDESYQNKTTSQELIEVVREENGQESIEYELITRESILTGNESPFKTFNLAGRLNLLIGIEQEISSGINFHVEPYINIPLSGLSSQDLKFTTSGIRCKVSF